MKFEHPYRIFAWTICSLLLLYVAMEGWRYSIKPSMVYKDIAISESLNQASDFFQDRQETFLNQSKELSFALQKELQEGYSPGSLYDNIQNYPSFWGVTLMKDNEPVVWSNFPADLFESDIVTKNDSTSINVLKRNNVLFWLSDSQFTVQDSEKTIPYHLYTMTRIEQKNALMIGDNSEYSFFNEIKNKLPYPVTFSIFTQMPAKVAGYRTLKNVAQDSIGAVYALPSEFDITLSNWSDNTWFWRSIFIIICFSCMSIVFSIWIDRFQIWESLFFQLIIASTGWAVFKILEIPARWIPTIFEHTTKSELITSYQALGNFSIDCIFIFLIAFIVSRKANHQTIQIKNQWYPFTIFIATLVGFGNVSAVLAVIYKAYTFAVNSQIQFLDLNIFPGLETLFFYLSLGLLIYALLIVLISVNRFILRSGKDKRKLIAVIIITSFVVALFISQLFIPEFIFLNWAFTLSIILFTAIFGIAYLFVVNPRFIHNLSTLRTIAIGGIIISMSAIPIIYHAYRQRQDWNLKKVAFSFSQEKDPVAEKLTTQILNKLEEQFRGLSDKDLSDRVSFVQAQFSQTIEKLITPNLKNYSVDLHFVRSSGKLIAEYSTDLNSPDWVSFYDLQQLASAAEIEQIDKYTNRPIVQLPEIKDKEDYKTFYRGWIPIFENTDSNEPIAWILCSIYKERPDFNKPIRAVMASLSYDDWKNTFQMLEYKNNNLVSSATQGVTGYYPEHNKLLKPEQSALKEDSLVYYNTNKMQHTYRYLLWRQTDDRVLKIGTMSPDFKNILFCFFRFNFVLIFAGSFVTIFLHLTKLQTFTFLGKNERFQDRILDNFLLATLVFLTLLVITTHFAIKEQNEEFVKQDLFNKLQSLAQLTESNPLFKSNFNANSAFSLDSLTSPLNVDASFYNKRVLSESTTPQIYQQYLLPATLPFPVYQSLFGEEQRDAIVNVSLASQDLMIGYRSVLSPDRHPIAAIAIPTFVQSPKYNHQLLETTSYLIILYFLVFGLFIMAAKVIAQQITKPLQHIREGLNKISKGNLNTKIPIASKDEIGNLAAAYNQMISRLKELQTELAKAEREAAWKEMAQQVAHEIKNPLTPIKLNIQHLNRQLASDRYSLEELKPKIKKITHNIIDQIKSLNNIASDFSKFSKPIDEEFTNVSINEVLESVTELYQHDPNIHIKTELAKEDPVISGIQDELKRVLINLIKNAFEAMSDGGEIMLRSYTQNESVFIELEDHGEGISEEYKAKIFVPNFSTKSSGTGLGLAICKKVVEAHDGSISFVSIKGEGTTFMIKLPLDKLTKSRKI